MAIDPLACKPFRYERKESGTHRRRLDARQVRPASLCGDAGQQSRWNIIADKIAAIVVLL